MSNYLIFCQWLCFYKQFVLNLKKFKPKKLIVYSRDELKQYEMKMLFKEYKCLRFFLGDVMVMNIDWDFLIYFTFLTILGVLIGTYSSIFVAAPVLKFLKVSHKTLEKKEEKIVP